jgi:hypothetical protein
MILPPGLASPQDRALVEGLDPLPPPFAAALVPPRALVAVLAGVALAAALEVYHPAARVHAWPRAAASLMQTPFSTAVYLISHPS